MKILSTFVYTFLLIIVYSQPLMKTYTNINYDSIAKSNFSKITFKPKRDYVYRLRYDKFQISVSSKLRRIPTIDTFSDLTIDDIIFAGSYDIRARFYISPNVKVFQRLFITGLSESQIFHTTGVIIKF
jgi:hypothetical protein